MKIESLSLDGLFLITPDVYEDERGIFLETYNKERYFDAGIHYEFLQDNLSRSHKGVLRGLHFQAPPYEQGKLVSVIVGSVWDIAVDIRQNSPTYGKWQGITLNAKGKRQFWISPGFAHGFVALENDTVVSYKCTKKYNKESEGSIIWNDPDIAIDWPIRESEVVLSEKDAQHPQLSEISSPFTYEK